MDQNSFNFSNFSNEKKKKIAVVLMQWINVCCTILWFLCVLSAILIIEQPKPKGKKRKASVDMKTLSDSILQATDILCTSMNKVSEMLSRSLATDKYEQRTKQLYALLSEIYELSTGERNAAYGKCILDPTLMTGLLNLPPEQRLDWIKQFLQ